MPTIAAITDIAVTVGVKFVEKVLGAGKLNDDQLISMGVAVGYFYNFLDPVSRVIKGDSFQLYKSPDDKDPVTFESEQIKLQVLVPKRLDVYAFENAQNEFKAYHNGFIYMKENSRYYGINYFTTELPKSTAITIVDLARPLMSVKRFYEDILKVDTSDSNMNWMKSQIAEISAFKTTLKKLQERGYGALVNKLTFSDIG